MQAYLVVGGDERQRYLQELLQKEGKNVRSYALPGQEDISAEELLKEIAQSDTVILPLPVTKDGMHLFTVQTQKIELCDRIATALQGKTVFGGQVEKLYALSAEWKKIGIYDYYADERFTVQNALATAEGAVYLAMHTYASTLFGARCLVVGYGRIGKLLCTRLQALGAKVFGMARKESDRALMEATGITPCGIGSAPEPCDMIFNTVPAVVLTEQTVQKLCPGTLYIELASLPGGIDRQAAQRQKIEWVNGGSLPGRYAPVAAAAYVRAALLRGESLRKE